MGKDNLEKQEKKAAKLEKKAREKEQQAKEKELMAKAKGHETYMTVFEGHEIKVINKIKARMYIDGVEVAKEKGIGSSTVLTADIPDTDKTVIAIVKMNGGELTADLTCRFIIGEQAEAVHGFTKKDGSFVTLTPEEEELYHKLREEDAEAALIASTVIMMQSS